MHYLRLLSSVFLAATIARAVDTTLNVYNPYESTPTSPDLSEINPYEPTPASPDLSEIDPFESTLIYTPPSVSSSDITTNIVPSLVGLLNSILGGLLGGSLKPEYYIKCVSHIDTRASSWADIKQLQQKLRRTPNKLCRKIDGRSGCRVIAATDNSTVGLCGKAKVERSCDYLADLIAAGGRQCAFVGKAGDGAPNILTGFSALKGGLVFMSGDPKVMN